MKFNKKKLITLVIILGIVIIGISSVKPNNNLQQNVTNTQKIANQKFIYGRKEVVKETQSQIREYETMPETIKEQKVIGMLEIPVINLETYILAETNEKTLNLSVTKLAGPDINTTGNFCITGHNYPNSKMFFKLSKVNLNDKIILTDTFGKSLTYQVYEKKEIEPQDVEVLNQDTKEEKEITLITCTFGARKRIVVKAVECYD